jgi:hypothetical protein
MLCEPAAMEKSCPAPVRLTVCGLFEALSVIESIAVRAPLAVGLKTTPMEQLAPAAKLLPQELVATKSTALLVTLMMVSAVAP